MRKRERKSEKVVRKIEVKSEMTEGAGQKKSDVDRKKVTVKKC